MRRVLAVALSILVASAQWKSYVWPCAVPLPGAAAKVRATASSLPTLPALRLLRFLFLPRRRCYLRLPPLSLLVLYTVSAFRF